MAIARSGHTPKPPGGEWQSSGSRLFNTSVENIVEKPGSIFVTSSARDASTPCTDLVADTLVVGGRTAEASGDCFENQTRQAAAGTRTYDVAGARASADSGGQGSGRWTESRKSRSGSGLCG